MEQEKGEAGMDRTCIKAEHLGRGWHPWSRTSFQRKIGNCSSISRTDSQSAELSHPSEEEVCSQSAMVVLLNPPNTPSSKNFTSSGKGCPGPGHQLAPNSPPNGRSLFLIPGPHWLLHPGCIASLRPGLWIIPCLSRRFIFSVQPVSAAACLSLWISLKI